MIFEVLIVVLADVSGSAFGQNQAQYWPPVAFCGMVDAGAGYPVLSFPEAVSCSCSFQPVGLAIAGSGIEATDPTYQGWWAGSNAAPSENNDTNANEPSAPEQSDIRQQIYMQTPLPREPSGPQGSPPIGSDPGQQDAKGSKPTIYLIALKDHSIVQAIGLWEEGSVLYYVSSEYALNQVSDVRVDWAQSQQLNHKRGVELRVATAN